MLDLKIVDKIKAKFTWKGNKKTVQKAGKGSLVADAGNGQVIQITQHFEIGDIQALSIGGNDIPELLRNATPRLALEQAVKQDNFQKAVQGSELDSLESHKPLDKDWFVRWMEVAQTVGKEDIRKILSDILRGEVKGSNKTNVKTLEVVRNLSTEDLSLFKKLCDISFDCPMIGGLTFVVAEPYGSPGSNALQELGLSYSSLTELQDLGLIQGDLTAQSPAVALVISKKIPFTIGPAAFQQTVDVESKEDYKVKIIRFTKVGLEIRNFLELEQNNDYVTKFNEWVDRSFPEVKTEEDISDTRDTIEPESEK